MLSIIIGIVIIAVLIFVGIEIKIIEGKLYLFYNAFFNNTLKEWNKNQTVLKKNADANWIKISK